MILTYAILLANQSRNLGDRYRSAPALLKLFAKMLKLPPPNYQHKKMDFAPDEVGLGESESMRYGTEVMVRIPTVFYNSHLLQAVYESEKTFTYPPPSLTEKRKAYIHGIGHCTSRRRAQYMAAHEALLQIEQMLCIPQDEMLTYLQDRRQSFALMTNEYHFIPYDRAIPGITWRNIPNETSFVRNYYMPADRNYYIPADQSGNINFTPDVLHDEEALLAAKALTLASPTQAPTVKVHFNRMNDGTVHSFAKIQDVSGTIPLGAADDGLNVDEVQVVMWKHVYNTMPISNTSGKVGKPNLKMIQVLSSEKLRSYGLAKLYVSLPLSRFEYFDTLVRSTPKVADPNDQLDLPSKSDLDRRPWDLVSQGLAVVNGKVDWSTVSSDDRSGTSEAIAEEVRKQKCLRLTHLGRALKDFSVEPNIARMIFLGLALYAIDPALTVAALLSVPEVFAPTSNGENDFNGIKSDVIAQMESYNSYISGQTDHPRAEVFDKVTQIRNQLESEMRDYIQRNSKNPEAKSKINWNANSARVVVQAALMCVATPHIAHLVQGTDGFATRDVVGTAKMHPSSVNHGNSNRAYWYLYQEVQMSEGKPYLLITTAVTSLEIALFCDSDFLLGQPKQPCDTVNDLYEHMKHTFGDENWLYHVDRWIPVVTNQPRQRVALRHLRRLLMYDMMQWVARDPVRYAMMENYREIMHFALSALENQRIPPPRSIINDSKEGDGQSDTEESDSEEAS
jgi:Helicase associated domain (HA2)